MLAMAGLWRVRVLAVVRLVCTAHHLRVVPPQLLGLIIAGNVPLSHGLAFFFELLVRQRTETAECASNGVKDSHAQMLSRRGLAGKGGSGSGRISASRTVIEWEFWRYRHPLSSLRSTRIQSREHVHGSGLTGPEGGSLSHDAAANGHPDLPPSARSGGPQVGTQVMRGAAAPTTQGEPPPANGGRSDHSRLWMRSHSVATAKKRAATSRQNQEKTALAARW
jgi:hypothetical protein